MLRVFVLLSVAVAMLPAPALPQGVDPHALYEDRCAGCHSPHASELATGTLELRVGELVTLGRGQPLEAFLQSHRRTALSTDEINALLEHFLAILSSGGLYREKCISCHERAREFARLSLIKRDNRIIGRYSGRDIEAFLAGHGRLEADEATTIVEMFSRQMESLEQSGKR